jgi:hypothetical protein
MSTVTAEPSRPAGSSLATSTAFRTFATVMAIGTTALYVICELVNLPLFTYHPGTNRIDWGFARAVKDEGPAMYWYGWTATSLLGGAGLGLVAMMLPESLTKRIPLALVWLAPILATPILIYALRFFWKGGTW